MKKKAFGFFVHGLVSLLLGAVAIVALRAVSSLSLPHAVFIMAISLVYGLLPDIDIRSSVIYGAFITMGLLLAMVLFFYNQPVMFLVLVLLFIITLSRHRGFVHTWWFGAVVAAPLLLLNWHYALVGFVSFMLHLLID